LAAKLLCEVRVLSAGKLNPARRRQSLFSAELLIVPRSGSRVQKERSPLRTETGVAMKKGLVLALTATLLLAASMPAFAKTHKHKKHHHHHHTQSVNK
jgi:hypothetical protein